MKASGAKDAATQIQKEIESAIARNGTRWLAELDAAMVPADAACQAVTDAVEEAYLARAEIIAAKASVQAGGSRHVPAVLPVISTPTKEPNLVYVLAGLRAVLEPPPAPRPTVDEDGTPMTGYEAMAKLASGERRVGVSTARLEAASKASGA